MYYGIYRPSKFPTYKKLASNCLVQWYMLFEEYRLTFVYIKGEKNVVANALSRLDMEVYSKDTNNLELKEVIVYE